LKFEYYYRPTPHAEADIEDLSRPFLVNCVGMVDADAFLYNRAIRNDFYLIYVTNGFLNVEINNTKFMLEKGNFLIIPPRTPYYYHTDDNTHLIYFCAHFTGYEVMDILNLLNLSLLSPVCVGIKKSIEQHFYNSFREFMLPDGFTDFSMINIIRTILCEFARRISPDISRHTFKKSIQYINEMYYENISVEFLAKMEDMSESYYRKRFLEITNTTPHKYIIDKRLSIAYNLLEFTNQSVSEIAQAVGYEDEYYFCRIFKKKAGISPGKYRQQITKK